MGSQLVQKSSVKLDRGKRLENRNNEKDRAQKSSNTVVKTRTPKAVPSATIEEVESSSEESEDEEVKTPEKDKKNIPLPHAIVNAR